MAKVSILGASGSIGRQALSVIENLGDDYRVVALTANTNRQLLAEQARRFNPQLLVLSGEDMSEEGFEEAEELRQEFDGSNTRVEVGEEGLLRAATWPDADIVLMAVMGFSGFRPTLAALRKGKRVALANKESLVVGGELLAREFPQYREQIIPVDSEHSAVFQCLCGENRKEVRRVILTASGGPFHGWAVEDLRGVTPEQALRHPSWQMGAKITIDSATLMNKGFEVLEACWLFNLGLEQVEVLIHPQSLVHSLVEFVDGSVIAQVAPPDMRLPIQYALTYPRRETSLLSGMEWGKMKMDFEPPDTEAFPCLAYAYRAGEVGGTMPACLNAANEVAVDLFLGGEISFTSIGDLIKKIMDTHDPVKEPGEGDILAADRWAREKALEKYKAGDY